MVVLPVEIESTYRKIMIDLLKDLGFKDGISLDEEELKTSKDLIFWEDILDTDIAQTKPFYLVFTLGTPRGFYADNKAVSSTMDISIDLFTTYNIASKSVKDMRLKLENKLQENKDIYSYHLLSKFYDAEVKLNHLSYMIRTII